MVNQAESILKRLALPAEFGVALLIFCFVLSVAPYLGGLDVGVLKVPVLDARRHRRLRVLGPVCLILTILLHVPMFQATPPASLSNEGVQARVALENTADASEHAATMDSVADSASTLAGAARNRSVDKSGAAQRRLTLLIPSDMSAATVWVNDQEPMILDRTQNTVVIAVKSVPGNLRIRLENSSGRVCAITQMLTADRHTLNPCYP